MALQDDYDAWLKQPFPRGIGQFGVDEFDLGYTCHGAAGCISTYLDDHRLEDDKVRILEKCLQDCSKRFLDLPSEASGQFEQLVVLCRSVLVGRGDGTKRGMSNREDPLQVSGDIVNTRPSGTKPR